jgi:hypothetical protein
MPVSHLAAAPQNCKRIANCTSLHRLRLNEIKGIGRGLDFSPGETFLSCRKTGFSEMRYEDTSPSLNSPSLNSWLSATQKSSG